MKKVILYLTAIFALGLLSCKNEASENNTEETVKDYSGDLNISVLIDLSDRIDPKKYPNPTMDYYKRDVGYINSISEGFMQHLMKKKIVQINDNIQVYFDPAPLNPDINAISKDLKFELDKQNVSNQLLAKIQKTYKEEPIKLYQLAIKDNHYVGSDLWNFFKNKIRDNCIEENHRNVMVILTDGYIYYKNSLMQVKNQTSYLTPELIRKNDLNTPDWSNKIHSENFGFLKGNENLSNLEVLVLGINPDPKNPYEADVIKAYWTKWFETMKVKRYKIETAELPSEMDHVIKEFLDSK